MPRHELRESAEREGGSRTTVTLGYNCLLFNAGAGWAMIDAGLGSRFLGYGGSIEPMVGQVGRALREARLTAAMIGTVLFSHLHQDHARGSVWSGERTFPEATAFAHEAEIAYWSNLCSAGPPTAGPHRATASSVIRILGDALGAFHHGVEVMSHVRAVDASGHTPGHTAFVLGSGGDRLLCVGDSFYDPMQLRHPRWRTPWDHDAEASVRSRRGLLDLAAEEDLLVHAYHMPFPGLGRIRREGAAFRWTAVMEP